MASYNAADFDPPAPVAEVILRNPATTTSVPGVSLLMDTGADITLLPRVAVEQTGVRLEPAQQVELMGFDGARSFAPVVTLDMIFLNRVYRDRYLLCESERGILGRDVLNHVKLLMDGPGLHWNQQEA